MELIAEQNAEEGGDDPGEDFRRGENLVFNCFCDDSVETNPVKSLGSSHAKLKEFPIDAPGEVVTEDHVEETRDRYGTLSELNNPVENVPETAISC